MSWVEFQLHYDVPECVSQLLSLVFVVILTQVKNQGLSNSINLNPSGIPKGSVFCSSFGVDTFRRFELTKSVNASEAEQHIYIGLFIFFLVNCRVECVFGPQSHLSCVFQQMLYMFNQKETGTKRLLTTFCLQSVREKYLRGWKFDCKTMSFLYSDTAYDWKTLKRSWCLASQAVTTS